MDNISDFNEVLYYFECMGDEPLQPREITPLVDYLADTGLMDLKAVGY